MTPKDVPFESPQEVEPQAQFSPLHKPRRRSKHPIVFVLPVMGCLVLLAGGGILLWQFAHPSQSSKPPPGQGGRSSSGQLTPSSGCTSRLPGDWIAQQLPPQIHLTEAQVKTEVQSGKSVQAIAAAQGIAAQQLYQVELHIMHAGNVRWQQQGCLSQSEYNDNERRAKAMTPAEMDRFFTSLYQR